MPVFLSSLARWSTVNGFLPPKILPSAEGGEEGKMLTSTQLFTSGVFAGLANGVVSGPVEHIRIRELI